MAFRKITQADLIEQIKQDQEELAYFFHEQKFHREVRNTEDAIKDQEHAAWLYRYLNVAKARLAGMRNQGIQ